MSYEARGLTACVGGAEPPTLIATVEMVRVRGLIEGSACAPTDIVHARASGMMINIIEQLDEHEQRLVVPYGSLATYTGRRGGRGWDVLMLHPDLIAIMMVDTRRLHGCALPAPVW